MNRFPEDLLQKNLKKALSLGVFPLFRLSLRRIIISIVVKSKFLSVNPQNQGSTFGGNSRKSPAMNLMEKQFSVNRRASKKQIPISN